MVYMCVCVSAHTHRLFSQMAIPKNIKHTAPHVVNEEV